jgi:hypothetical protein
MVNFVPFLFAGADGAVIITLMSRRRVTAAGQRIGFAREAGQNEK